MKQLLHDAARQLAACQRRLAEAEAALALAALSLAPGLAHAAAAGGGAMPYSSWLTTFKTSVQGEIAQIIAICVIVGGVAGWIIAGQLEGLLMIILRVGAEGPSLRKRTLAYCTQCHGSG